MAATATKGANAPKKKTKISLQPLGDKVVVERDESQSKTAGGIVLPDSAKDKPARGTIVAIGTDASEEGRPRPLHQLRPRDDHHRRRGVLAHERERHPRRDRVIASSIVAP
jgi:hypothetical protein